MSLKDLTVSKIYFYLVSFIGLLVILFNAQIILTTSLRYYLLKTAPQYLYQPPFLPLFQGNQPIMVEPITIYQDINQEEKKNKDILEALSAGEEFTETQKSTINIWFEQYEQWKKDQEDQNKRIIDNLVGNIVYIVIFSPAFLYHFKKAKES